MTAAGRSTALATGASKSEAGMVESPETLKIEARCKQCGETFVKYAYQRTARCEACRKEGVPRAIQIRYLGNCMKADPAYGKGVAEALGIPLSEIPQ